MNDNTVAYLLKARNVEPEKQPLLVNGSETKFVLGNGLETDNGMTSVAFVDRHVPIKVTGAMEELCFLCGPAEGLHARRGLELS
jgi:hypothetical protein